MSRFNFDSDYDDDEEKREQDEENLADDLFLKDQIISVQQENNDILKMEDSKIQKMQTQAQLDMQKMQMQHQFDVELAKMQLQQQML